MKPNDGDSFLRQCRRPIHEFGWLIHLLVTLLTLAYFAGGLNATVAGLANRLDRLEQLVDSAMVRTSEEMKGKGLKP